MSRRIKVGVLKAGCLGSLPLMEFLLDERADRDDIDVLVSGSGSKVAVDPCRRSADWIISQRPDFTVFISPAQHAPGPRGVRKMLVEAGIPTLVVSDGPAKRIVKELESDGLGYIIVDADAMIGARREFLDPVEMALFNSDIIRVLSVTGVIQVIVNELDGLIQALKEGVELSLPRLLLTKEAALEASGMTNPYAKAKAMASYEIAKSVARVDVEACFKVNERSRYIPLVASAHEMIRVAAWLADEARELEKGGDTVVRKPHYPDGSLGFKRRLLIKPERVGGAGSNPGE